MKDQRRRTHLVLQTNRLISLHDATQVAKYRQALFSSKFATRMMKKTHNGCQRPLSETASFFNAFTLRSLSAIFANWPATHIAIPYSTGLQLYYTFGVLMGAALLTTSLSP